MKIVSTLFLSLTLFYFCAYGKEGGPVPVPEFESELVEHSKVLPKFNDVSEFIHSHSKHEVIYRDQQSNLRIDKLDGSGSINFGQLPKKLGGVSANGKFLYLSDNSRVLKFNLQGDIWYNLNVPTSSELVFWNHNQVYHAKFLKNAFGHDKELVIYRTRFGIDLDFDLKTEVQCQARLNKNGFRIADGSSYPDVYLYRVENFRDEKVLNTYRVDLDRCKRYPMDPSQWFFNETMMFGKMPVRGNLKSVLRFPEHQSVAIVTDHPTHGLFWKGLYRASFVQVKQSSMVTFPNPKHPVAVVSNHNGITIYYLDLFRKSKIYPGSVGYSVNPEDIVLSNDSRQLFIRMRTAQSNRMYHYLLRDTPN